MEDKYLPSLEIQGPMSYFGVHGRLKSTCRYYSQVQLQLYATDMDACDLVLYSGKAEHVHNGSRMKQAMSGNCAV